MFQACVCRVRCPQLTCRLALSVVSLSQDRWWLSIPRSGGQPWVASESDGTRPNGAEMAEKTRINWRSLARTSRIVSPLAESHRGINARLPPKSDVVLLLSWFFSSALHSEWNARLRIEFSNFSILLPLLRPTSNHGGAMVYAHFPICTTSFHQCSSMGRDAQRGAWNPAPSPQIPRESPWFARTLDCSVASFSCTRLIVSTTLIHRLISPSACASGRETAQ